ncbi:MAG: type II toxin-antitoxin system ParD family antitoxin [Candidatus Omnitrophota bacterium]|nr:MAG: type II toxin-antitoxin system ParD family antitoxin [Candidatus Omnitrophota bacterium]
MDSLYRFYTQTSGDGQGFGYRNGWQEQRGVCSCRYFRWIGKARSFQQKLLNNPKCGIINVHLLMKKVNAMNISLSPDMEKQIAKCVASGKYTSINEVIEKGLRILFEIEEEKEVLHAKLRNEIQVGLDQLDHGKGIDGDLFFGELTNRLETLQEKSQ